MDHGNRILQLAIAGEGQKDILEATAVVLIISETFRVEELVRDPTSTIY